jgi:hypothetical protein
MRCHVRLLRHDRVCMITAPAAPIDWPSNLFSPSQPFRFQSFQLNTWPTLCNSTVLTVSPSPGNLQYLTPTACTVMPPVYPALFLQLHMIICSALLQFQEPDLHLCPTATQRVCVSFLTHPKLALLFASLSIPRHLTCHGKIFTMMFNI